jgi:hypothetical protein
VVGGNDSVGGDCRDYGASGLPSEGGRIGPEEK